MTKTQKKAKALKLEREIDERLAALSRAVVPREYRRKEAERIQKMRTEATRLSASA